MLRMEESLAASRTAQEELEQEHQRKISVIEEKAEEALQAATSQHEQVRDGDRALALVGRAEERMRVRTPRLFGTLAAARAARGEYDKARAAAQQGIAHARARQQEDEAAQMQLHLASYQRDEALHL